MAPGMALSPISPAAALHSPSQPSHQHQSSSAGAPSAIASGTAADGAPSTAGTGTSSGLSQPQHKRVYQACIPCRRRKVRCDLGSVDNPHDPPCMRCRRESKECYFSATRRKRKADDGTAESVDEDQDEYMMRNGRKQQRTSEGAAAAAAAAIDRQLYRDVPLTPGGGRGRSQPVRRSEDGASNGGDSGSKSRAEEFGGAEPNMPLENFEARTVMRREVYGPHDALDLLYKAATDNPVDKQGEAHPTAGSPTQANNRHGRPEMAPRHPSNIQDKNRHGPQASRPEDHVDQPIDPELINRDPSADPGYSDALRAWARFRFVRAGWFTAQEAISYIDYYYEYLSPLTPVSPPTFRNPTSHLTLLTEEPILTVTLLTIASRYRRMPGTGGHCRSHAIHEQLWMYLRGMIERVLWGQEAFGGGFCGSGDIGPDEAQNSSTAPWRGLRRGSLRTLGTIESLMILTEWHPRALHFPPDEAIDELLLPSYDMPSARDAEGKPPGSIGGRRIESWLEPAWRSDRMCWMLLSTAMGLAYELGVFDDIEELLAAGAITRPEYEEESYRLRAYRIKRLLLIYLSQLAGRLGWTNMVPENLRRWDPVARRRPVSVEGTTPGTNPSSLSNAFNYIPDLELDDQIIHCWAGISHAMHMGNEKLFRSRKHTTDIIQSGKYTTLLKEFQPMLKDWWREFQRFRMPPYIRHILTIEYEYVRIYVNSLSLQAVVERCTNSGPGGSVTGGSASGQSVPQLSPHTQNIYARLPLAHWGGFFAEDQEYVKEVVSGSRNLLRTVVEGLLPGEYLKHVPVRTYFRIISGAMFLLKTFAVGAPRSDVEVSMDLMDRTVDALRNCIVDDVHLGIRFADMLETLTTRLRNRFIYARPQPPPSTMDGRSPAEHNEFGNGAGANDQSHSNQQPHGPEVWAKLREGTNGLERSSTPANISATPWDLTTGAFPFPAGSAFVFAPPTPGPSGAHGGMGEGSSNNPQLAGGVNADSGLFDNGDWQHSGNEMWYLTPGPTFFQNMENSAVAMTAEGVNVGGLDLLEYMAMDPMDPQTGVHLQDGNGFWSKSE